MPRTPRWTKRSDNTPGPQKYSSLELQALRIRFNDLNGLDRAFPSMKKRKGSGLPIFRHNDISIEQMSDHHVIVTAPGMHLGFTDIYKAICYLEERQRRSQNPKHRPRVFKIDAFSVSTEEPNVPKYNNPFDEAETHYGRRSKNQKRSSS